MNRRDCIQAVASLPVATSVLPAVTSSETDGEDVAEPDKWTVRGVWRRRDETGYLAVREEDLETEFEAYSNWVRTTIRKASAQSGMAHVVDLCDFRLISLYTGAYCRSHFAHSCGLEVTIKRDPTEEVEFMALVTHIDELWEDKRIYRSSSQLQLAEKLLCERNDYVDE